MAKSYCIVVGNEKGGSGKSTTAMHISVALLELGYTVLCVDVDAHQGTLARYVENRAKTVKTSGKNLLTPECRRLYPAENDSLVEANKKDEENMCDLMRSAEEKYDFIVIDTPGHKLHLSRIAHNYAHTLITPLNDSFVDVDVIASINAETLQMDTPSSYAHWVWEMKKNHAAKQQKSLDWIVVRNRLSTLFDRNKAAMGTALQSLSKRLGFRVVAGFAERVIFKEFFLRGLTLFDLKDMGQRMTLSHIAAKGELYALLQAIQLEDLRKSVDKAS